MSYYIVSDPHFNHSKMAEIRGFKDVINMNEYIIFNWNKTISFYDIVLCFGDLSFGGSFLVEKILSRLNGKIFLIPGNHDRHKSSKWWKEKGIKLLDNPLILENYVLSHEPLLDIGNKLNYHGHIHLQKHYEDFLSLVNNKTLYKNLCIERLNYKPLKMESKLITELQPYLLEETIKLQLNKISKQKVLHL